MMDIRDRLLLLAAHGGVGGLARHLEEAAEEIERLREEIDRLREEQRWIPVDEEFPEDGSWVLFWEDGECHHGMFINGEWRARHPWPRTFRPSHWMPPHAPPKTEEGRAR